MDECSARTQAQVEKSQNDLRILEIDRQKWKHTIEEMEMVFNELNKQFMVIRNKLFVNKLGKYERENRLSLFVAQQGELL